MLFQLFLLLYSTLIPFSPQQEAADGKEDNKDRDDACPEVCLARGSGDGIVLWDEALAREGIEDSAICLQGAVARIYNGAWHRKDVRNIKPEDVQAVHKLLVQLLAQRVILVEEHSIGIGVEEVTQGIFDVNCQNIILLC